ncbi:MAG: xylulokinase, partial [Ardenticatenaceae bacterium]
PLWRQILADVFDTEIVTVNVTEGAAYGAALLAGVGGELYESVIAAAERVIQVNARIQPGAAARVYEVYYPHYRALYPALAAEFQALAEV